MHSLLFRVVDRLVRIYNEERKRAMGRSLHSCGVDLFLGDSVIIWGAENMDVGDHVCLHSFTHIFAGGGVRLGSHVYISAGCSITSLTHAVELGSRSENVCDPIVIEDYVWLGTGAIVLPGVTIGRGAVIGAGAVVTADIPPMSVAVGVPARVRYQHSSANRETCQAPEHNPAQILTD